MILYFSQVREEVLNLVVLPCSSVAGVFPEFPLYSGSVFAAAELPEAHGFIYVLADWKGQSELLVAELGCGIL